MDQVRPIGMSIIPFVFTAIILLVASQTTLADEFRFTDSGEAIVRDGGEWRYDLPQIPRNDTYLIQFMVSVQNERLVDVRLVDSVNDTMEQQGRIDSVTIYWKPDLRYTASDIVVTPSEDDPDSHTVLFSWEVTIYNEVEKEEEEGPNLWEEHGLLIMGIAATAVVIVMLSITLKAPGGGEEPKVRKDMGTLRHHGQKMR